MQIFTWLSMAMGDSGLSSDRKGQFNIALLSARQHAIHGRHTKPKLGGFSRLDTAEYIAKEHRLML